ncbi:MAG: DsbA family protein [Patescibacteria group bacterium]|jgi:protein-disulfide isomerase
MAKNLGNLNLEERTKYLALKEKYKKKLTPWYKRWWGIVLIIILGLVLVGLVAAGFYISNLTTRILDGQEVELLINNSENELLQKINPEEINLDRAIYGPGTNYSLGPDDALITIVEFADFACPYCAKAYKIAEKLNTRYPDQVKFIYRDLPLHETSIDLALAARCAGEQGRFWEMHNQLFANQSALTTLDTELKSTIYDLAGTLGINAALFDKCFSEKKYTTNIAIDLEDAITLQVEGTPSWFINGRVMTGYLEDTAFITMIDNYLKTLNE